MGIRQLWPTPLMEEHVALPEDMRQALINVLVRKEEDRHKIAETAPDFHQFMKSKKFYASTHYNLFDEADQHPERDAILAFERVACKLFRRYLRDGLNIEQADEVKLAGRAFGNVQEPGARTFPHYHQTVDGVMVHYLAVGDGSDPEAGKTHRHGSHALLCLDPRGAINYPYWEKLESISPYQGLTVIHPGYLWHETNTWRGDGTRVVMVVNFQVVSHGYVELHREMRF